MWRLTTLVLILIILAGLISEVTGTEIIIGLNTLLWLILGALVAGAVWTLLLFVSSVSGRIKKWMS